MKMLNTDLLYSPYNGAFLVPGGDTFGPSDNGCMGWNYDGMSAAMSTAFFTSVSSVLYMTKIKVDRPVTPTKMIFAVQTAGTIFTSADCALFTTAGVRLAVSASITTQLGSTGVQNATIAPGALVPGYYHIGIRATFTGTAYKLVGFAPTVDVANAGLGASDLRFGAVTAQTTMPSSVTMGSRVNTLNYFWAGVQ